MGWKIVPWTRGERKGSGEVLVADKPRKRIRKPGSAKKRVQP
jgi:hypothetical protein